MLKKALLIAAVLTTTSGCTALQTVEDNAYLKVGVGYKFGELPIKMDDGADTSPVSARIELGSKYKNITYGYTHRSQWFSGFPFNNDDEYYVDEFFIDYTIKLTD